MASRTFEDPAILDVASSSNMRAAKERVKVREMEPKELLGNLCYKHSLPAAQRPSPRACISVEVRHSQHVARLPNARTNLGGRA